MKLTVVLPFAVPARTLAVLVLGASLGGLPRAAHSQTTPADNLAAPVAPNTTTATDTDTATAADTDTDTTTTPPPQVQAPVTNRAYVQTPNRPDMALARTQTRQAAVEQRMRDMMARNGITTTATQDAILTFLRDDEENKRAVRDAGRKLWNGIRRDVPVERLRSLLSDYQKSLQTAHDNRVHAQTALDARVGYSLDPHLESLLWLLGVLGDGQTVFLLPQPAPSPRGPRIFAGNGALPLPVYGAPVAGAQVQIEGVVNAKNSSQEGMVWLEIRDASGRVWRMVPSNNPDAQPILTRQIGGLNIGAQVVVRLVAPAVVTPNTPYSLVALANKTAPDQEEGTDEGATTATDDQYK